MILLIKESKLYVHAGKNELGIGSIRRCELIHVKKDRLGRETDDLTDKI